MKLWIRSAEDSGVRRRSQRNLRISTGENHRLARQPVQVRRQSQLRAEESYAVGANRVHRYQDDIRRNDFRRRRRSRQCAGRETNNPNQLANHGHGEKFITGKFRPWKPGRRSALLTLLHLPRDAWLQPVPARHLSSVPTHHRHQSGAYAARALPAEARPP
jgi:hypothetical protein